MFDKVEIRSESGAAKAQISPPAKAELDTKLDWESELYLFAPVAYFMLSRDGTVLRANLAAATLLGVERSLLPGLSLARFVAEGDRSAWAAHGFRVFETKQPQCCDITLKKSDGSRFLAGFNSVLLACPERDSPLWLTSATNLTTLKRDSDTVRQNRDNSELWYRGGQIDRDSAEGKLHARSIPIPLASRSEREPWTSLDTAIDPSPTAAVMVDDDGTIVSFSRSAERIFGFTAREVTGKNIALLLPSGYNDECQAIIARQTVLGANERCNSDRMVFGRRKEGAQIPLQLSIDELYFGPVRRFVFVMRRIGHDRATASQVRYRGWNLPQVHSLNTARDTASTLAHELSQPITAIMNYVEACRRMFEPNDSRASQRTKELMHKAVNEAKRAGEVMRRLRRLVEGGETERADERLETVIAEIRDLIETAGRESRVTIDLRPMSSLPLVSIDKIQVQQVILNLTRNAIEAMRDSKQRRLSISAAPTREQTVEVTISDSGPGFLAAANDELFRPMIEKKAEGLGLGLWICHSIIEAQGGRIWATPRQPCGTIFHFTLPVATIVDERHCESSDRLHRR